MKKTFLLLIAIPLNLYSQNIHLIGRIYGNKQLNPATISCSCTFNNVLNNGNISDLGFEIDNGYGLGTDYQPGDIYGYNHSSGSEYELFFLFGVANLNLNGNYLTSAHKGVIETNDFGNTSIVISSASSVTFSHFLSYIPNYVIPIPKDPFTGNVFKGWYLISTNSSSITIGFQDSFTGILNFAWKAQ